MLLTFVCGDKIMLEKKIQIMRMIKLLTAVVCLLFAGVSVHAKKALRMASPDGNIVLRETPSDDGKVALAVDYHEKGGVTEVMQIPRVGMSMLSGRGEGLALRDITRQPVVRERYTMATGKRRECANTANEYLFRFTDTTGQDVLMRFRLFNDGIAFRYEFPSLSEDKVKDEHTTYHIAEGTRRWMQRFNLAYEDFYPLSDTGGGKNRHWGYPALVQAGDNVWALLSEAGIERSHSASSLKNDAAPTDYKVTPARNDKPITGRWHSPWRVMIIGSLQTLVASTLITDVSPSCTWEDTSWVRPGSVSWIYWAYNHGSRDFQLLRKYIDMAVTLKLPYVLIDAEWDEMGNGGTIDDVLRYAAERNVRPLLWYNSTTAWINGAGGPKYKLNKPEDRDREFAWLAANGVAGVKIDFFDGDTEETMAYCQDLLESAARHGLMVNLHGATIPRGWQRTYPNLLTVEAVYGAEWYNNLPVLTNRAAAHNATLPFTRNVIGSMDYTPCTFSDSQHPHITSHAHELALAVLFESGWQHWADKPDSYLAQPREVQDLMGQLPTVWDETRLLSGYPGDYAVMARRLGRTWYVAAINGGDAGRAVDIDWSFLKGGKCQATIFADSGDKTAPWSIRTHDLRAAQLPRQFTLQPRGGLVVIVDRGQ